MIIHQTSDEVIASVGATLENCLEVVKRDGSARELITAAGIPFEVLESVGGK